MTYLLPIWSTESVDEPEEKVINGSCGSNEPGTGSASFVCTNRAVDFFLFSVIATKNSAQSKRKKIVHREQTENSYEEESPSMR